MDAQQPSNGPGRATEIAEGLYTIDTGFQGNTSAVAVFLVVGPNGLGLIETGPASTLDNVIAGIADAGYSVDDVQDVVVTHIHLDHAGALGTLMRDHARIKGWVHPVGLPHLVSPERLVRSATRIYGDRMEELWGEMLEVPEDRLTPTEDRAPVSVGGRSLIPFDTPGHASHHVALLDEQTGSLFTGDVAGVRIQGMSFPVPPMPPPDIDIDAWKRSIDLMRQVAPERLVLTHFSTFADVQEHFDQLRDGLDASMALGREVLLSGGSDDELTGRLGAWIRDQLGDDAESVWSSLDAANPLFMGSMGIHRVLRKAGELDE